MIAPTIEHVYSNKFNPRRWREHRRGLGLPDDVHDQLPKGTCGTVGAVALDTRGLYSGLNLHGWTYSSTCWQDWRYPYTWVLDSEQKNGNLHQILGLGVEAISRLLWEYLVRRMETSVSMCVSAVVNKAS